MPVAIPVIAVALTAVGAGVAAYSSAQQGKAAEKAGKATASAERANAIAAQQQAQLEANQVRRRNRLRLGANRAAAGKSGVDLENIEDVQFDTAVQGELEALATLYSGATSASYYRSRADIAELGGRNAKRAGYLNAGATLLSGAGSAAGQFSSFSSSSTSSNPTFRSGGGSGTYGTNYKTDVY